MKSFIKILYITILNIIFLSTFGQSKLILYKGFDKEIIQKNKLLGVTLIGEKYRYQGWKSILKCDSIMQNLWIIDSIGFNSIFLSGYNYKLSLSHETILRVHMNTLKNKNYIVDSIVPSEIGVYNFDKFYCSIIKLEQLERRYKKANYDSIESFTFAHLNIPKHTESDNINSNHHDIFSALLKVHCSDSRAEFVVLAIDLAFLPVLMTVAITDNIVNHIEAEVHTYYLKDWKIKIE